MTDRSKDGKGASGKGAAGREERLWAALRANLQRRKQQARARAEKTIGNNDNKDGTGGGDS